MNTVVVFAAQYLYLLILIIAALAAIFADGEKRRKLFKLSLIAFPLSFVIGKVLNYFIYSPRPFVVEHIQPLISHAADNGFPSDHTLLVMTVTAVMFSYNKKLATVLFIFSLIVGVARVIAKIHHPVDILGSTLIAFVATYIGHLFLKKYTDHR